ncbi:MAG: NIL domain-containing protein, partial [Ruminococcus sp.]|nr:NIL domain-containing protein [Ruminococcus sp.]
NTEPVVTEMARTLDTDFSICWAKLEDFRTSVYGSLVINLKEKDRESVCDFLDKKILSVCFSGSTQSERKRFRLR